MRCGLSSHPVESVMSPLPCPPLPVGWLSSRALPVSSVRTSSDSSPHGGDTMRVQEQNHSSPTAPSQACRGK